MLTYIFDKKSHMPLYEQLYHFIRNDILSGTIEGGEKLPSKRELASHLGISKVTVENAYSSLISEGYVYSLQKKGYYAEKNLKIKTAPVITINNDAFTTDSYDIDLSSNSVPTEQFPFTIWTRLVREQMLNYSRELLNPVPYNGALLLRKAISTYLLHERGMNVSPSRIVVGAGSEYLYSLIIHLLGNEKVYGIEFPSYHKIKKVYDMNNAATKLIPITEGGINKDALYSSNIDVIHISPSHNFPTGIVMSARNRHDIIDWADKSEKRFIIEDDFDSELRFTGKPLPPMQTLDTQGKVIYINTFSKTISPSFRIGYMILPDSLADKFKKELGFNSCTVPSIEQYTLAEFIEKGYFERHINRMKKYYKILRTQLIDTFESNKLSSKSILRESEAGLHFNIILNTDKSDGEIKEYLESKSIKVSFMSDYNMESHNLLVNYSGLDCQKFSAILDILNELI